ncbi:ribonuclease T2 [Devosia crocina]|uniref:Ribonuclease T2 n=1 Tax=Devosia crocina TaxID=429728 RepID=A0A1I7N5R6_9HYPH|nr:hypothetical protein [Devosia crocina]SFV30002.1 ribonuclease T2 [Devosia crocina]
MAERNWLRRVIPLFALFLPVIPAQAEVPLDGTFTAARACPALQSINRQTNPGGITITPGATYALVAANKANPTHYRIVIPNAEPDRRWVEVACGTLPADARGTTAEVPTPRPTSSARYVLAVNWQPAFCELSPRKPECRNQGANSFEATNFTLHGLWPQPRSNEYCDVVLADRMASEDGRWRDIAPLDLPLALRRELDRVMPGSQSGLDRHEWIKHGTCYGTDARTYYRDLLDLMTALNTSPVADLFAGNIGRRITLRQIRSAFDDAFGSGAGARVRVTCAEDGNRTIITELTISLAGEVDGSASLPRLIAAAPPTDGGCDAGEIDAVGTR